MIPGIHRMSNADYHAAPGASRTGLNTLITRTPAHYKFGERVHKPFFDIGTAAHTALLEPETLEQTVVRGPDDRRGNRWKEAQAEAGSAVLLTSGDYDRVLRIRDAGERSDTLRTVRRGALIEHAGFATDPETGVQCRCKPDAYSLEHGLILDLKTTTEGGREAFGKSVARYGYHMQEAFYSDVWELAACEGPAPFRLNTDKPYGAAVAGFLFVVIETTAPFIVSCYELSPDAVDEGRAMYRAALVEYAACSERERLGMPSHLAWPGYPDQPEPLDIPRWAYRFTQPQGEVT